MWASLGDWSLPLKRGGGSWQDKVFFLLDLKASLLLWVVLLRSGMGEDSLFSPSMSSWLTAVRVCFCVCLVSLGTFGLCFFLFLVQFCMRGLLSRDCLWYIPDGGYVMMRLSAQC